MFPIYARSGLTGQSTQLLGITMLLASDELICQESSSRISQLRLQLLATIAEATVARCIQLVVAISVSPSTFTDERLPSPSSST